MRFVGWGAAIEVVTIGVGVAIVVEMIGVDKMGSIVVTCCTGGDEIIVSEMCIGETACIVET